MAEDKIKDEILEEETVSEETTEAEAEVEESSENAEGEATEAPAEEAAEPEESGDEKYLRLLAEFQNFKRRTLNEKKDIREYANQKIVGDLLPVLDNFERALATNAADDPDAYAKGMSMILEQLLAALTKVGVKEMEALGEEFDPNKHNAVMHADSEEYEEGKVCNVFQKGYELNGKVVRAAMVAVAK